MLDPVDEVWHELVLNGVGGRTIAEAKDNMTVAEFNQWIVYRQKRGSLNLGRRIEQAVGISSSLLASLNGSKNHKTMDFMPHEDKQQSAQQEISLSEAMKEWQ